MRFKKNPIALAAAERKPDGRGGKAGDQSNPQRATQGPDSRLARRLLPLAGQVGGGRPPPTPPPGWYSAGPRLRGHPAERFEPRAQSKKWLPRCRSLTTHDETFWMTMARSSFPLSTLRPIPSPTERIQLRVLIFKGERGPGKWGFGESALNNFLGAPGIHHPTPRPKSPKEDGGGGGGTGRRHWISGRRKRRRRLVFLGVALADIPRWQAPKCHAAVQGPT